jgi:prevent-host-death family protein
VISVPLDEAKDNLSELVDAAAAGQTITITQQGRAMAQLVPLRRPTGKRIGAMKGILQLPDDLTAPLSDCVLDGFEGACS